MEQHIIVKVAHAQQDEKLVSEGVELDLNVMLMIYCS
jgi:hypothetical protein